MDAYGWLSRRELEQAAQHQAEYLRQRGGRLRRSELELLGDLHWPSRHSTRVDPVDPGPDVAILTVANDRFYRGLEALLLSLRAIYPQLTSPVWVVHDGTLGAFLQRRLELIHPLIRFVQPQPDWAAEVPTDSRNRQRIGILGYLNSHAFALRGYRRVLVLDSDLLITGALDPLWAEGESYRAVPDCGDRPWAAMSRFTHRPVLNSGVLSLPGWALCDVDQHRFERLIKRAADPVCPLLDCFADQKVWNLFLADQPMELMPLNFNCNVKYLVQFLGGYADGLSVLHFAGPKPWLTWPWVEPEAGEQRRPAVCDHLVWNRLYRQQLMAFRLELHRRTQAAAPPLPQQGPAMLATDPTQFAAATSERPESCHLLLADPHLFGPGWPDAPHWPPGWLEAIQAAAPLQLWAPFEWEPAVRALPLPAGVHWRWLLIEAPFSPALDQGADLIAEDGQWQGGFEPWCDPPLVAVERAVRRRLRDVGSEPRFGLAGDTP
jgi:hypothetical protein